MLDRQIAGSLAGLTAPQVGDAVVAYEPVWAIGTGRTATSAQAQEAHRHIRQRLSELFGPDASEHCHILYGGSVKPENVTDLVGQADVDGALIGGASLDVNGFATMVTSVTGVLKARKV